MKAWIVFVFLFVVAGCGKHKMQIPADPAIPHVVEPIYLQNDTVGLVLGEYFLYPEKVKKINLSDGLGMIRDKDHQVLRLWAEDTVKSFFNISFHYENYTYDIPVICQDRVLKEDSLQILTDEMRGDSIYLRSSALVERWFVYLENYKLKDRWLHKEPERLGFVIPLGTESLNYGVIRIWAVNPEGVAREVVLPFSKGKLVVDTGGLNLQDSLAIRWEQRLREYDLSRDTNCMELVDLLMYKSAGPVNAGKRWFAADSVNQQNQLYLDSIYSSMALRYGDYILLRKDKNIYAYLRCYFDREWIIIANRSQETMTLKLDLPRRNRTTEFNSFFGNRFSYDNSRLIVDVPARRAEVIYR